MLRILLMLSLTFLWGGIGGAIANSEGWVGTLTHQLNAIEHAADRAEKRLQIREATTLLESIRQDPTHVFTPNEHVLLERAATLGVLPATMVLGEEARKAGDLTAAFTWFRHGATQGYPPAMIQVGLMYSNGDGVETDMEKASAWLRPANVKGSSVGKYLLAECFLYGKGVERNPEMAVMLLRESANLANPGRSLDLLATCYHRGWGVIQDSAQAAVLYGQACDEGFQNACANLAVLTMTGNGVPQDSAAAVALLQKGVEQENGMCMFFYAAALLDGLGDLEPDESAARGWFQKAARAGNEPAAAWCRRNQVEYLVP